MENEFRGQQHRETESDQADIDFETQCIMKLTKDIIQELIPMAYELETDLSAKTLQDKFYNLEHKGFIYETYNSNDTKRKFQLINKHPKIKMTIIRLMKIELEKMFTILYSIEKNKNTAKNLLFYVMLGKYALLFFQNQLKQPPKDYQKVIRSQ